MQFIFNLFSNNSPRCVCKSRWEQAWKILKLNKPTTTNIHCTGRSHFIEVLGVTQSHNVDKCTFNPNKLFMVSHSWTCIKKPPPYLLETRVWLWDLTTLGISDELTAPVLCVCFVFKTSSVIYIIYIEQYAQSWYPRNLYLYVILKKQRANRKPNCSVKRYFSYKRSRRLNQLSPTLWATGQCGQVRDTRRRGGRSNAHYSGILFLVDESHKELTGGFQIGKHSECLHPLDAPSQHLPPDGDSDPADSKGGARPLSGVPSEARPNNAV